MKKFKHIILCLAIPFFIAACDNSIERANNAIGLIQDQMTKLVNELYEMQNLENQLQANFEDDLKNSNDNLGYFNQENLLVIQNSALRLEHLTNMEKAITEIERLMPELINGRKNNALPMNDFESLDKMIQSMKGDLSTYITDYRQNISLETQTFHSIGNPDIDYSNFFKVFDNINQLSETNLYNLDRLLVHFEPINQLIVDTKVKVVTLLESK
ncbi:YkyA family protein [Aerococcaceae bacterium zg-ZJ1578]|uniref:YkyA family protein n=1 Tax=Aerococcaceae bacterium zg-252 TaxID=2796928 RepID=UPI001A209DB2|nr:YkyA family protein [Aerococcaceae bacterium zg-1578]MBR7928267.1 YkyA family protein [Aerococcaceae bacterium zg-ZUI334]